MEGEALKVFTSLPLPFSLSARGTRKCGMYWKHKSKLEAGNGGDFIQRWADWGWRELQCSRVRPQLTKWGCTQGPGPDSP